MINYRKLSKIGDELSKTKDEEHIRSAVNRYYYSVFIPSRSYLINEMKEYEFRKKFAIHSRVCDRLINSKDNTEHDLGLILNQLRVKRTDADYEVDVELFDDFNDNLDDLKNLSSDGLDAVDYLKNNPPRKLRSYYHG